MRGSCQLRSKFRQSGFSLILTFSDWGRDYSPASQPRPATNPALVCPVELQLKRHLSAPRTPRCQTNRARCLTGHSHGKTLLCVQPDSVFERSQHCAMARVSPHCIVERVKVRRQYLRIRN